MAKIVLLILVAFVSGSCTSSVETNGPVPDTVPGTADRIQRLTDQQMALLAPPAVFAGTPKVRVIERIVDELPQSCMRDNATVYGCQAWVRDICVIWILKRVRPQEAIRRHELAHCNGWVHHDLPKPRLM